MDLLSLILKQSVENYHPALTARIFLILEKHGILYSIFTKEDFELCGITNHAAACNVLQQGYLGHSGTGKRLLTILLQKEDQLKQLINNDFLRDIQVFDVSNQSVMTEVDAEVVMDCEEFSIPYFLPDLMEDCICLKNTFTEINLSNNMLGSKGILEFLNFIQQHDYFAHTLSQLNFRNDGGEQNEETNGKINLLVEEFKQSDVLVLL